MRDRLSWAFDPRCPNGVGSAQPAAATATPPQVATPKKVAAPQQPAAPPAASPPAPNGVDYDRVVAYLQGNTKARPGTVKTLTNAIAARFKDTSPSQAAALVQKLIKKGLIKVDWRNTNVTYEL